MANSFQTTSTALGVLKQIFQAPMVDQLNEDLNLWRGIKLSNFKFTGTQVNRPIKYRRNPGTGAGTENGNMPKIGKQGTAMANVSAKYNWLRFGVTGPMIKASANDAGAFVRIAAFEMEEGMKDLQSDLNRQLGYDGSGLIARVNTTAVGSTSLVIKGREDTEAAQKFIDVDMELDIYTSGGTLVATGLNISSISGTRTAATATLTLDQPVSTSSGDYIYRARAKGNEIQGVLTLYDGQTSSVYGLDRSVYVAYNGNVIDKSTATNTQLALDDLQQAQDTAEQLSGTKIKAIFSDYAGRRYYQKLLTMDKRYMNTMKGDGSFSSPDKNYLEWSGIPWVADKDFAPKIFMADDQYFEKMVQCEFEWADETGAPFIAQTGVDALEARLRFYANVFNAKPAGGVLLKGYTSP